jgi:preprotein translocase subunit SecG
MENFFNNLLFRTAKVLLYVLLISEILIIRIILNTERSNDFGNQEYAKLIIMASFGFLLFILLLKYYSELKDQIKKNNPKKIKS